MKKLIALVLALVMALSLTTVAWGATHTAANLTELEAAVAAAADGDTIDLTGAQGSIAITGDVTIAPTDKEITIDATGIVEPFKVDGGKLTIGANVTITTDTALMGTYNGGEIVFNGGKVISTSAQYCVFDVASGKMTVNEGSELSSVTSVIAVTGGTLDIMGGTVSCTDAAAAFAYDGTINVYGGEVKNNQDPAVSCALIAAGDTAVVNVYGGTVESVLAHVYAGSKVNIEGGTITKDVSAKNGGSVAISGGTVEGNVIENAGSTVTISGGTFTDDVSDYVADGKTLISDGAGGYVVAAKTSGSTTTNTVKKDGYSLVSMDNTLSRVVAADFTKTTISPKTVTSGNVTTTTYYADRYVIDGTVCWACDASIAEAKLVKNGVVVAYLTTDTAVGAGVTKVASAFVAAKAEPACGEYDVNTYVVGGKNYVVGTSEYVLYNGLVVGIGGEATAEPHDFTKKNITTDTKGAIVSIKCDNCKKSFTVVGVGKVPATYAGTVDTTTLAANGNVILMGTATTATSTVTGTVNSADTFDAGIAMYVGMSVMAAAGSAVVIGKKKD